MMEGGASLKFLFFNKQDAEKGVTDELGVEHKSIMEHFEFLVNGKPLKDNQGNIKMVSDFGDLDNILNLDGVKGYIDEKVVYKKLNKRAFTGTEKQRTVTLIELKMEAVKFAARKTVSDISKAANYIVDEVNRASKAYKQGLYVQGDELAVTAAIEIFKSLSDEKREGQIMSAKEKFFSKLGYDCIKKSASGGYTESFDDNDFLKTIFGYQDGGVIDSESQDGGAKTINLKKYLSNDTNILKSSMRTINEGRRGLGVNVQIDSVLIFETRVTGPAKIFGLGLPDTTGNLIHTNY